MTKRKAKLGDARVDAVRAPRANVGDLAGGPKWSSAPEMVTFEACYQSAMRERRRAILSCIAIVAARHGNDYTAVETLRQLRELVAK